MDIEEITPYDTYNNPYIQERMRQQRLRHASDYTPVQPHQGAAPVIQPQPDATVAGPGPAQPTDPYAAPVSGSDPSTSANLIAYMKYLFSEIKLQETQELMTGLSTGSAIESLTKQMIEVGKELTPSNIKMPTELYHLDENGQLVDTHSAEDVDLSAFVDSDGRIDAHAAAMEIAMSRSGERSPAALEKEADYMDAVAAGRADGSRAETGKRFAKTAMQGALLRTAMEVPGFQTTFAANPQLALGRHADTLADNLRNVAVAFSGGEMKAYL